MQKLFSFPVRGPLSGQPLISPAKPTCCYVNTLRIIRYAHKVEPEGEKRRRGWRISLCRSIFCIKHVGSGMLALAVANCYTSHSAYKILLQEPSGEATLSPKRPIYYHGSRSLLPETGGGEREFAHPKFAKFEELNLLGGLPPSLLSPSSASYPPPAVCEATNVAKIACVVGPRFCLSLNLTIYTRDWKEGGSWFRLRM